MIPVAVFLSFGMGWVIRNAAEKPKIDDLGSGVTGRNPAKIETREQLALREGKALLERARKELETGENLRAILSAAESIGFVGYGRNGKIDDSYPILLGKTFKSPELEKIRFDYFKQAKAIITQPREMEIPVWYAGGKGWEHWTSKIRFTDNELFFAFGSDPKGKLRGTIQIFDAVNGSEFEQIEGLDSINDLSFSRGGRYLFCDHTNMRSFREPRHATYYDFYGGLRGATRVNDEFYSHIDDPRSEFALENSYAWDDPQKWSNGASILDWIREKYKCDIIDSVYGNYPDEVYFLTSKNEIIWSPQHGISSRLSLASIPEHLTAISVSTNESVALVGSELGNLYTVDLIRPWEWESHEQSDDRRIHESLKLSNAGRIESLRYLPSQETFAFESADANGRISVRGEPPTPELINMLIDAPEPDRESDLGFETLRGPLGRRELMRLNHGNGVVSNRIFRPRLFHHIPASLDGIEIMKGKFGGRDGYSDVVFLDDGGILIIEAEGHLNLHEPKIGSKIGTFAGKLPPELIKYLCENTKHKQKHLGLAAHGYGGKGRLFARSADQIFIVRGSSIEVYDQAGSFLRAISLQDGDKVAIWGIFYAESSDSLIALASQLSNDGRTTHSSQQICHIERSQWIQKWTPLDINFIGRNIYRNLGSGIASNGNQFFYQPTHTSTGESVTGQIRSLGGDSNAMTIEKPVKNPYFLLDERFVFQAESDEVLINDLKNGTIEPAGFQFEDDATRIVICCYEKRFVIVATEGSNRIELLDFDTGRKLFELVGPGAWKGVSPVKSLHLNCDGSRLLVEGHDGYWCWDLESLSDPFVSIREGEELDLRSLRVDWDYAIAEGGSPHDRYIPTSDIWKTGEQFQIPALRTLSSKGRDSRSSHIESVMTYYANNDRHDEARLLWEEEERYFTEPARQSFLLLFAEKCRQKVRLLNHLYEQIPKYDDSRDEETQLLLRAKINGIERDLDNTLELFLAVARKSHFANFHTSNLIVDFGIDVTATRSGSSIGYSFYEWFEQNAPAGILKSHLTRIRNLALSESLSEEAQERLKKLVSIIDSTPEDEEE